MIIGISGKSGAGKDTSAIFIKQIIESKSNKEVIKLSFAKPLKKFISNYFGYTYDEIEVLKNSNEYLKDISFKGEPVTMRQLLQLTAEEFKNLYGKDFWLNRLKPLIDFNNTNKIYIITDVRFENEYDFLKDNGGIMLYVIRDEINDYKHISEKPLHKAYDSIIFNRSIYELNKQLEKFVEDFKIV